MKRGTPNHPKVYALAEALGVRRVTAVGYLEMLFHFTATYSPAGDIGRFSDKRIATGVDWAGRPEKLVEALLQAGFLDRHPTYRLVIHDWHDHADESVKKRLARAKISFASFHSDSGKASGQRPGDQNGGGSLPCLAGALPEPEPEPEPDVEPPAPQPPKPAPTQQRQQRRYEPFDETDLTQVSRDVVAKLARDHPTPGNISLGTKAVEEILKKAVDPKAIVESIYRNHAAYCEYWKELREHNPRAFIPQLHRWFQDGDYMHAPPARSPTPPKESKRKDRLSVIEQSRKSLEEVDLSDVETSY